MTIILQHQFWDLTVGETGFEVGLSFGGVPERLSVPFAAINGFFDPSVQFGLQFEQVGEGQDNVSPAATIETKPPEGKKRAPAQRTATPPAPVPAPANPDPSPEPPKAAGGAEVVRLDRFRKK